VADRAEAIPGEQVRKVVLQEQKDGRLFRQPSEGAWSG
jgi:hypothetical protein